MKLETDIIVSMTMSLIGEVVILVMYFKMWLFLSVMS
jgi:hypothetical protein